MTEYIDLEPTWVELGRCVAGGALNVNELKPALEIADKIRQAQKKGAISISFTFDPDGIDIEEIYPDGN